MATLVAKVYDHTDRQARRSVCTWNGLTDRKFLRVLADRLGGAMTRATPCCSSWMSISTLVVSLSAPPAFAAEGPQLRELRVQQAGTTTYFHAVFDAPHQLAI